MTKADRAGRVLVAFERGSARLAVRLAWYTTLSLAASALLLDQAAAWNDYRDAQVLFAYEQDAVRTVLEYGQLPLWNPWYCGGLYALGNPQTRFAAPPFLLSLLLGAARAQPLIFMLMAILGMEGAYRFFRLRNPRCLGPALASPIVGLGGLFISSYVLGWTHFLGFELTPWALWGAVRAAQGKRDGPLVVAVAFAAMVGFGGTYAAPMTAVVCVLEVVRSMVRAPRRVLAAWAVWTGAALGAVAVCAFRLWPIVETLRESPRLMLGVPGHEANTLRAMLLTISSPEGAEYGLNGMAYVGVPLLFFAPLALTRARSWLALALLALGLWTAAGYYPQLSLFSALRHMPVFEDFRYPERWLFFAGLYLAELAGLGITRALGFKRRTLRVYWGTGVLVIAAISHVSLVVNTHNGARWIRSVAPALSVDQAFHQARGNRWGLSVFGPQNRGSLSCWEAYPVRQTSALRADAPAEELLIARAAGSVERSEWSPSRLVLRVDAPPDAVVRINQNYHPGWHASVGEVFSDQGLLAVRAPPGNYELTLRFMPRSAYGGALISTVALAGLVWFARRRRTTRWALAPALAGALSLALTIALWSEPALPRPTPTNPDGSAALVDELPPGAQMLGASFGTVQGGTPIELVAARRVRVDLNRPALELFWRVTGPVDREVGVLVHADDQHNLDHWAIAASFSFHDAPKQRLLRDVVALPAQGARVIHVGLRNVRTNRVIAVQSADSAQLDEGAVVLSE